MSSGCKKTGVKGVGQQARPARPHFPSRYASYLQALEPRMMFDGAAVATGAEVISATAGQMTSATHFALPDGIDGDLAFRGGRLSDFAIPG